MTVHGLEEKKLLRLIFCRFQPSLFGQTHLSINSICHMNILDFVTEKGVKVINSPESLRKFNEKLYVLSSLTHPPHSYHRTREKLLNF